jgi:hypothetical protein
LKALAIMLGDPGISGNKIVKQLHIQKSAWPQLRVKLYHTTDAAEAILATWCCRPGQEKFWAPGARPNAHTTTRRLQVVTEATRCNMSNCRFGRCDAFLSTRGWRTEVGSMQCSAHSGITRHLHFAARARTPKLFARGLCRLGLSDPGAAQLLSRMIEAKLAFLISGGTGSGKTTLLAALLALVPSEERIVIVEDSRELAPNHPHVVRIEGRPANTELTGAISLTDLVRQSRAPSSSALTAVAYWVGVAASWNGCSNVDHDHDESWQRCAGCIVGGTPSSGAKSSQPTRATSGCGRHRCLRQGPNAAAAIMDDFDKSLPA